MKLFIRDSIENQRGFTLIELVVSMVIIGIIALGAAVMVIQILLTNSRSSARMLAIKQVENAVHWLSRDVQMAQSVELAEAGADNPAGTLFPLSIAWTDWETGMHYHVVYSLEGEDEAVLERQELVYDAAGNLEEDAGSTTPVASGVATDPAMTSLEYAGGTVTLNITAVMNEGSQTASESRTASVVPRPLH